LKKKISVEKRAEYLKTWGNVDARIDWRRFKSHGI